MTRPGDPDGPRRSSGRNVALVAIGIILLAVLAGCVLRERETPSVAASRSAMTSSPRIALGFAAGEVVTNNGGVITVEDILGGETLVRTTARTRVLVLGGTRVSDVQVGDTIVVNGDRANDGSITAKFILASAVSGDVLPGEPVRLSIARLGSFF